MSATVIENERIKKFSSPEYNFVFDKTNGNQITWGRTIDDEPIFNKYGPTHIDMEISTICHGPTVNGKHKLCSFCYKSSNPNGKKTSFETFKTVFDKFPKTVCQLAAGIGTLPETEDDPMWPIFQYMRDNGVIPNVTINGARMNDFNAKKLAEQAGAIAVSIYDDKELAYSAIARLGEAGAKQLNFHYVISEETLDRAFEIIDDISTDPRLQKYLKAIVFLSLKPKGNRNKSTGIVSIQKYAKLIEYALEKGVSCGSDSCGASIFTKALENHKDFNRFKDMVESCDSTLSTIYLNVDGVAFPCSFTEDEPGWETGIDVKTIDSFEEVWHHPRMQDFRKKNMESSKGSCHGCRQCVTFPNLNKPNKVIKILEKI